MNEGHRGLERKTTLVSVVVPTYNQPEFLQRALASVRAQTSTNWEAIIIDDGSEETNQQAIAAFVGAMQDPRIRVLYSKKNRGPSRARNLGIRLSRGRYISFLDADDVWDPEKLEHQLADIQAANAYLSCTAYRNVTADGVETSMVIPDSEPNYDALLRHNVIGCSTVMLDSARGGKTYFPDLPMRQDFAHWLAILRAGRSVRGLPAPLTTRYVHRAGLSRNKLHAAWYTWQVYRKEEGLGLLRSLFVFSVYAWKGLARTRR